jgi:membrane protease YdiL (CAAX protease family)
MILETKKGKTLNIWLEFLIFILLFIILEMIKGIFTIIPMVIEIFKSTIFEITVSGEMSIENIERLVSSVMSSPLVMITMLFSCAVTIAGVIIYCKIIKKRSYASIGMIKKGAVKNYLVGMLLGAVLLFIIYFILFLCGHTGKISYGKFDYLIVVLFFGFIIQSASEEFLMRGYFMNSIAAGSNIPAAVIFNSAIFMALHLLNSGVTFISMVNILIFGLIFSLLFLLTENIWMISGMHFLWNFASGCIIGSNVSGMEMQSVFYIPLTGDKLFAGGQFGIEGSIVTTGAGVVFIVVLILLLIINDKKVEK